MGRGINPIGGSDNRIAMFALLPFLLCTVAAHADVVQYRIQPASDKLITLEVEKTGLLRGKKHVIVFPKYAGTLAFDAAAPENSKVELSIDSRSVEVRDTWLSEKDQKKVREQTLTEMLSVSKYPEMRFASTKVTAAGANKFSVDGTLTIRGIGKPVRLEVTFDPATLDIKGNGAVKLTSYSLKPPSAGLGTVGTKDEMKAIFDVRAAK